MLRAALGTTPGRGPTAVRDVMIIKLEKGKGRATRSKSVPIPKLGSTQKGGAIHIK